jgi:hypothetical protein
MFRKMTACLWIISGASLAYGPSTFSQSKGVQYPATPVLTEPTPQERQDKELVQKFLHQKVPPNYVKTAGAAPLFFQSDQGEIVLSKGAYEHSVAEFVHTILTKGIRAHQKAAYEHLRNQLKRYQEGHVIGRRRALLDGLKEGLNAIN